MKLVTAQLERLVEKICCGLIVAPFLPFKRLKGIFQVYRCAFNEYTGVNPNLVAQKLFNHINYTTADFVVSVLNYSGCIKKDILKNSWAINQV